MSSSRREGATGQPGAVKELLGHDRARWFILLIALLLTSTSLTAGKGLDDFLHELMLRKSPGVSGLLYRPLDLFSFATGDARASRALMDEGVFPWWADTHAVLAFLRPLSSFSHWIDYRLWPESPLLMHLQSLVWFGVLIFVIGDIYRRFQGPGWVSAISLILYAFDDARGPVVGWLANRNAIIALTLALPALVAHHRFRAEGYRPGLWLGPLALGAGLLAGEMAMIVCGYILSYALFIDRGPRRLRILSLLPYIVVVLSWRGLYLLTHYGSIGSGLYIDPGRDPVAFLRALTTRFPVLLLGQFALPWADLWDLYPLVAPRMRPVVLSLAAVVTVGLVRLLLPLWKLDPLTRFWAFGCVLAMIPVCSTFPHDRLLMGASVGGAALLAKLFTSLAEGRYLSPNRWVWAGTTLLGLLHLVLAPALLPIRARGLAVVDARLSQANATIPSTHDISSKSVVLINPPVDPFAAYFPIQRQAAYLPRPKHLRWLATGVTDLNIERVDNRTLRVRPSAGFLSSSSQLMLRSPRHPMRLGETVTLPEISYEVTGLTNDGRPSEVLVRFRCPLEDRSLVWLQWGRHGFVPFSPPIPGAAVLVPAVDMGTALLN